MAETCYECSQMKEVLFTIKSEDNEWPDRFLCSTECLDDFIVVADAEELLDNAYYA